MQFRSYHHPILGAGRFPPLGGTSLRSDRYTFLLRGLARDCLAAVGSVRVSPNSPGSSMRIAPQRRSMERGLLETMNGPGRNLEPALMVEQLFVPPIFAGRVLLPKRHHACLAAQKYRAENGRLRSASVADTVGDVEGAAEDDSVVFTAKSSSRLARPRPSLRTADSSRCGSDHIFTLLRGAARFAAARQLLPEGMASTPSRSRGLGSVLSLARGPPNSRSYATS